MTPILPPVSLEDKDDPTWERALIRLAVAFELAADVGADTLFIVEDENMSAYINLVSYLAYHGDDSPEGQAAATEYFVQFARPVKSWTAATQDIYPWFHNGEEMPK